MLLATRLTARALGVPEFRWFREPLAVASGWRMLAVRVAGAVAPFGVAIALSCGALFSEGAARVTTRLQVNAGPAQEAGLKNGDRIVSIAGLPISNWDALRSTVQRHEGPTAVVVERNGAELELTVAIRDHRLGVAPVVESEQLPLGAAVARGVMLPFRALAATVSHVRRVTAGHEQPEFQSPIGIVAATAAPEKQGSLVTLAALLATHLSPSLAGIPLFDALLSRAFRSMHPSAAGSPLRGYRLERLRLGLLLGVGGYLTVVIAVALVSAGVPMALALLLWAMPSATAIYPLMWIAGREVWGRSVLILALGIALFVPCFSLVLALGLLRDLRRALRNEGFSASWFCSEPVPR